MMTTAWLNSVVILDNASQVFVDIYGVNNDEGLESIWIIQSKSFNGITTVIDAWSYRHG